MAEKNSSFLLKFSQEQNSDSELESNFQQINDNNDVIWREWFFNKIDKILDITALPVSSSNGNPTIKNITVIFGHAGSGKTFLVQLLCQNKRFQSRILMPFFCKFTSSTPIDFISKFENQIQLLFGVNTEKISLPNVNVNFRENLLKILNSLTKDSLISSKHQLNSRRFLLLIDSIDLRPDICDLISSNLDVFPNWLHIIITARPKRYRGITKMFSGARKIVIDDIKKTNIFNDLMNYLTKFKAKISPEPVSKHLLNKIVHKSNGSILYIRLLLDTLEQSIFTTLQLDFVGATLNGLYLALFSSLFNQHPQLEADFKSVLSTIDRINDFQVSLTDLQAKLDCNEEHLNQILKPLLAHRLIIYTQNESHIRLVHASLFEWLSDIKHCTSRFICHSYYDPTVVDLASKNRNLISNKYINDNDDSINDISENMLYDKEQSDCLLNVSDKAVEPSTAYLDTNYSHIDRKFPLASAENRFKIDSTEKVKQKRLNSRADLTFASFEQPTPNCFATQFESVTSSSLRKFYPNDDDCVIESEDEPIEEHCDLSKTEISKEYLDKLFQKFENALHLCDLKTLCNILSRYANVTINQSFIDGKTPLYWAIKKSNMKLVELFIEFGADINAVCDPQWGYTPLILALMQHSYDMCELLLENDADVELLDRYSMPPIMHAILVNCSPEIIRLLLYWGAHTDFIDEAGRSLLHFAANEPKMWPETISLLLTVGCDEMHRDNDGQTALHMASANGSLETVEVLVEFGGDKLVHTQDKSGLLPLHEAVAKNNSVVCEPLITPKSINCNAHNGNSPLRIAILSYYLDLAQLLILKGADINYKDADGRSIIYCVVAFTHSTLEQKGPPFFNVSALYKNGPEEYLETAVKTIEFLVRFGIDLEIKDHEGRTALHVAAWQGTYPIVECLIQLGADINAVDAEGRSPLHMCSWNGHIEVVRLLIESSANVNHVSSTQGATPLLVAAQQGHLDTCRFLLQAGSNVAHRDLYGRNARDVAMNCGHGSIVSLIESFVTESEVTNNNASDGNAIHLNGIANDLKFSKYDSRFYSANSPSSSNSVPNKKGVARKNKKTRSISKLTKILH